MLGVSDLRLAGSVVLRLSSLFGDIMQLLLPIMVNTISEAHYKVRAPYLTIYLVQTSGKWMLSEEGAYSVVFSNIKHVDILLALFIDADNLSYGLRKHFSSSGVKLLKDDTAFEKQSSLFALAVSDIVLINMWCHDIGREQAANKPLLKTVFQVMMRLFCPRKTTLLFVIRDKTKTPLEHLEPVLREDIQKIWDSVPKPEAHKDTALSEFFNVEVTALSSFEEKEEQFIEQVKQLRQRFHHSIAPGGLAGDRRGVVPASGFSFSAQEIWKVIRENKDLDLPAHKVMVATVRCEEIANEKLSRLTSDESWLELEEAVQSGPVSGFGRKLGSILDTYLSEYDDEAIYFEESVRTAKRQQLESRALHLVHPAFQKQLTEALSEPVESLFEASGIDVWTSIRRLYQQEMQKALSGLANSLSGFELDQVFFNEMLGNLKDYARNVVEKKSREEASKVLIHMKDRFSTVFSHDKDSMPRVWTGKENIRKITKEARAAALKHLSVVAAIRLDEKSDKIENILVSALTDAPVSKGKGNAANIDPLASSSWEQVPPKDTLITPVQCKSLWRQFKTETEYTVTQAISAQEAHKRSNSWLPPPWALLALAVLGFNEFMVLLRNPLYLGVIFVLFLLSRALWVQLGIAGEFRNGVLPGILSISSKLLPTVMNLLRQLAEAGERNNTAAQAPEPSPPLNTQSRSQSQKPPPVVPTPESSSSSTFSSPRNGGEHASTLKESDTEASSTS
ncbi:uncharacterized protein A4U43_C07F32540 [Asparagus officinalis]|uniref:GB1/RHD3-type G domain-containing protein n=1 Tax=Asparagus officinalis TaxID=4686 RepID=A0A5P1ELT7_ASPOF|nr:uncharacterized protein A4U43_C07F32540 [Asparagus officinalis]